MRTVVWLVGVGLVALGAVLLVAPTFGFETIAADRTADLGSADDENATVGFEPAGGSIDAPDGEATVFRLRNNANQALTLTNSHILSIDSLSIASDGEGTISAGGYSTVSVVCGDYRGTDTVTLTVTVDEASGTTVTVRGASSAASFVADCDVPALVWNTTADWDAGSDGRTVSDDVGDRQSDTVRLGYGPNESGLVGYWPLDEDSGPAVDASGNGNDGTLHGDPTPGQTGILNSSSYDLDGDGDYVNVSHDEALELSGQNRVTVAAWVKKDSQQDSWRAITQKSNTGYNLQFANGNQPTFTISPDGSTWVNAYADTTVSTGEWHHLVGTYDGTNLRIYVDGRDATEGSPTANTLADSSDYGVGIGENLENPGRELDGDVDEVRIYERALSAAEVQDLYYTADNGTHTTDWRSTSVQLHADRLVLQNVSATLADANATVYVESDTDGDGAVNETSDPIALSEDVAEYDVTGIGNDTDRVRLRAEFETTNVTRTPILSRADLTEEYSNFTVAIDDTNAPVVEGEDLTVDVAVENTGSDPDTQIVELRDFDGDVVDSSEVQLDARSSTATTFTWNTQPGDNGTADVTVASDDDTATREVTVKQPATFDVTIDATNSPVKETEPLDVDVTVQNVGDVAGAQTVELRDFDGDVVDSTNVSLDGGETNSSITLTWNTQDGDNGTADVAVSSEDDTATREVTVDALYLISSCTTFDAEGTWRLTANVSHDGSSNCFDSNVDNVTFEGQGYTIDMAGTTYDAFFLKRYSNAGDFTVRNVTVDGGARAFLIEFVDRAELRNVTIRNANKGIKTYNEQAQGDDGNVFVRDSVAYDTGDYVVEVGGDGITDLAADRFAIGDPAANGSELDFDLHESGSTTQIAETSSPAAAPEDNVSIDAYFQILTSGDPVENVTLYYEDDDVGSVDEETIAIWRDDGSWTRLDSTVDAASNAVAVGPDLTTATDFGAFAEEPPTFDVAVDSTDSPVDEGQTLTVNASVTNNGDVTDTQNVTLSVDGSVRDEQSVTLDAGQSTTVELEWTTAAGDEGIYDATVATGNASDVAEVTVVDPDGTVWHTADDWDAGTDVRTVSEDVGDRENDTVRLGYPASESGLVSYWPFDEDDGSVARDATGAYDGNVTGNVSVEQPGLLNTTGYAFPGDGRVVVDNESPTIADQMAVSTWIRTTELGTNANDIDGDNQTVLVHQANWTNKRGWGIIDDGDNKNAVLFRVMGGDSNYDVTVPRSELNDGAWHNLVAVRNGTTIEIYVDGEQHNTVSDTQLEANEGELAIGSWSGDGANYQGDMEEVRLYNSSLTQSEVQALYDTAHNGTHTSGWKPTAGALNGSRVQLENVSVADVAENATVYVESDTDNDGAVEETSDGVQLAAGQDTYDVTGLASNVSRARLRVEFETDAPAETPVVSRIALGEEGPSFDVSVAGTNSPVTEGETLDVTANVTNSGDRTDTQTIELRDLDGEVVDSTNVTLAAGETNSSVALTWSTTGGDEGTGDVTIASPSDTATAQVEVQDGSTFAVAIDQAHDGIVEGEDLDVDVNVTNDGTVTDTETVRLKNFDGDVVDSTDVTLAAGETNSSVTLTWSTAVGDNGTDSIDVTSGDDDSATQQVTIDQQATFDVAVDGTNDPVTEGEDLTVDVNVTNVGDRSGTQTVELRNFSGDVVDSTEVSLAAGETNSSITLVWSTGSGDGGTDDVTVRSDDRSATQTVTIEQPAYFDVAIDGTNSPVEEGQDLTVDVNVTNTGDFSATQTVELRNFSDDVVDSTDVTLGAGETDSSIALNWSTTDGDAGSGDVTVSSENDSATQAVTVDSAGPVTATNVAADVTTAGDDQQYLEFEVNESMAGGHYINIDVSQADGNGVDYQYSGDETLTVVQGSSHVQSAVWKTWVTGPRIQLADSVSTGDVIRVEVDQYTTASSGGPWTVTFNHDGYEWQETDDFEIEG